MTKEGWFYTIVAALFALALLVYVLGTVLLWVGGAVLLVLVIYAGCQVWGKLHRGLTEQRLRNAEVESARARARERRHIAELKQEEVAAAKARRHLIPEGYIGAQLAVPSERALYHVWPQPSTITYNGSEPPAIVEADPGPLPTVHFRDIAHQVPAGQMLIGIRLDGSLRLGSWKDHKSILVLGKSSSGKTRTMAKLAAEAVKMGALLVVCDPHAAKEDSLARLLEPLTPFLLPGTIIAQRHEDILAQAQRVRAITQQRVEHASPRPPIVLFLEELNRLMRDGRLAEQIALIIQEVGQEGRGFEVYVVCGAQEVVGAALVKLRRSFISAIVHRIDEAQAKTLIPSQHAKKAPELPPGHTFVYDADGMTEPLRQALLIRADLEEIARRVPVPVLPVFELPVAPLAGILKPGQHEADVLQTARAAQAASSSGSSSEALEEEPALKPADIRVYLEKKEKKMPYTEAERELVLRLHLQEGLPASRIARAMGKDTNFYYEVKAILKAAYAAAGLEPDQEEEGTLEDGG